MSTCLFAGRVDNKFATKQTNLNALGLNTGNMLFWHSLQSTLDIDCHTLQECAWKKVDTSQYSSFITTDLIWIRENTEISVLQKQLEIVRDKPLIPISIGLQTGYKKSDFKIHENTLKILAELQERCILGIRGSYTAEILEKNGIKNIQVIGCPSMYYPFDYQFKIQKKDAVPKRVNITMRSLYSPLQKAEIKFMVYAANHMYEFCEQTAHVFGRDICPDPATFDYLNKWLNLNKVIFFDIDEWKEYMSNMDFSIGCRFHGNVIGLWKNVPALFITVDSRMTEMCEHFKLPTISMKEFDAEKDIQYYYELADYTEFNKNYADRLDEYISFLKKNSLPIRKRIDSWYDRRIQEIEVRLPR